jgi:CheY-like chemotaxis protein
MAKLTQISLIDDDSEDVFLIKRAFKTVAPDIDFNHLGDGYKFLNDIIEGLHQNQTDNFKHNIILLDINMPEVSGFDVLRVLYKLSLIFRDSSKKSSQSTTDTAFSRHFYKR